MAELAPALLVGASLSHTDRIEGLRAVERARYAFTLNATRPFDEVYPRSVFEKKVRRQEEEERVLRERFGLKVTPELLLKEYERIERETRAPEQWEAIKQALGGDRKRIEEIFCRPLLVERALRARFDFDPKIHAVPHQKAREARASFLEGKIPSGAKKLRPARKPEATPSTEEPRTPGRSKRCVFRRSILMSGSKRRGRAHSTGEVQRISRQGERRRSATSESLRARR